MTFGGFNDKQTPAPMAEINVTPMVDVMLVLLVIFIMTAPLLTQAIKLDLPQATSASAPDNPATIQLAIDASGTLYWNDTAITTPELEQRFADAGKRTPQPELRLRADKSTRYEVIAQVMASAQSNGLSKLGFVTEPKPTGSPAR
ncbi:biopolymer transporter ExbD [Actimicrobium antarcticum]|uniref:Biopolymer transporter ExbD n=1 Tax=Actimicrobium antarcticum TaxID=1051899 RepID=A0ABP7TFV9_9BURK